VTVAVLNQGEFYEASSPRVVARINGSLYVPTEFEVDLNAHGATSSASCVLPISSNPDFSAQFAKVGQEAIIGELFVGWPPNPQPGQKPSINGSQRVYRGLIAQYDPKFTSDRVTFEMRSLASPLVDEKIQMVAMNAKTVDFVQKMCDSFGLKFVQ
jgi:hypothetical protein